MQKGYQKKIRKKPGLPPGTLIHVGKQSGEKVGITLVDYTIDAAYEKQYDFIKPVLELGIRDSAATSWLNIDGLHDVALMAEIGTYFKIHSLVLEDILHTHQRPKLENHDDYIFIVFKMITYSDETETLNSEQVSLIIFNHSILTFQERAGDVFDPIRERIRQGKGRIRNAGPDYLAYSLIDAIIDNYYVVLDKIEQKIERLEETVTTEPTSEALREIHHLKGNVMQLRRSVWPLREVVNTLIKSESTLIRDQTDIYLKDLYDHTIQVTDAIDSYRDMLTALMDLHLSTISNRMNEVIKVLTIFAAIFIPLTFIVGIYGMNFEYMPELHWRYAYPTLWGVMVGVTVGLVIYFKRKKWF